MPWCSAMVSWTMKKTLTTWSIKRWDVVKQKRFISITNWDFKLSPYLSFKLLRKTLVCPFNCAQFHFIASNQDFYKGIKQKIILFVDKFDKKACSFYENKLNCMIDLFCNLYKVFDWVWYQGLLFKLQQNVIDENILQWLQSYLSNSYQNMSSV